MKPIQLILIPLLVMLMAVYWGRIRSRLFVRVFVLLFGLLGIVLVIMPDWATLLAHVVGVGRGTDLLFYFGLVGIGFVLLRFYSKLRELEVCITKLARDAAMKGAVKPAKR